MSVSGTGREGRPTAEVVDLAVYREDEQDEAWETYRAAAVKAQASSDIRDGIAAGKAWRRFMELFEPPTSRGAMDRVTDLMASRSGSRRGRRRDEHGPEPVGAIAHRLVERARRLSGVDGPDTDTAV